MLGDINLLRYVYWLKGPECPFSNPPIGGFQSPAKGVTFAGDDNAIENGNQFKCMP